ncbi:MAG: 50S ribosomal protein L10 [Planctomycetaceae bacterium]|jgi:large subunit ribosomal protein L10|nr:50S ribosomal protein L10 [Planctomycetaceae bacterium]
MSKYVKQLVADDIAKRLKSVNDAFIVSLVGMDANTGNSLRTVFAEKQINLLVVKNSLAKRALSGTSLAAALGSLDGSCAFCWGASDVVGLAKEIVRLTKDKNFKELKILGGTMDGEALTAEQSVEVSKWPSREEQISLLVGQIVGVGSGLSGQLIGTASAIASQMKQLADKNGDVPAEETTAA